LAPIHGLLFNKIKVTEALESDLINSYRSVYGEEVNTPVNGINEKYGNPIGNGLIEDLIDSDNIHGWLQDKIARAETRQAKLLGDLIEKFGEKAETIAFNVFNNQASELAKKAKDTYQSDTTPNIYAALNAYILEGMPCDNVNVVTIKEVDTLEWKNMKCLHKGYWEIGGANVETLYSLRFSWFKTFIESINPEFTHIVKPEGTIFVHQIVRKKEN
ncbi:MAG: hypothetical protein MUO60_12675, partial [Clostridiaceae bacterium]|nr:hypothetical protein [Clostridiaceae bacterium]